VEFTMPYPGPNAMPYPTPDHLRRPERGADWIDLLQMAATGMFPGPALEALIARLEGGK